MRDTIARCEISVSNQSWKAWDPKYAIQPRMMFWYYAPTYVLGEPCEAGADAQQVECQDVLVRLFLALLTMEAENQPRVGLGGVRSAGLRCSLLGLLGRLVMAGLSGGAAGWRCSTWPPPDACSPVGLTMLAFDPFPAGFWGGVNIVEA